MEKYDEAKAHFEIVLWLDPFYLPTYDALGDIFFLLGKSEEAISTLKMAITIDPHFLTAYNTLARIHRSKGEKQIAAELERKIANLPKPSLKTDWIFNLLSE